MKTRRVIFLKNICFKYLIFQLSLYSPTLSKLTYSMSSLSLDSYYLSIKSLEVYSVIYNICFLYHTFVYFVLYINLYCYNLFLHSSISLRSMNNEYCQKLKNIFYTFFEIINFGTEQCTQMIFTKFLLNEYIARETKKWMIIKLHLEGEPCPENHLMTAHRIFSSIMMKETSVLQKHKIQQMVGLYFTSLTWYLGVEKLFHDKLVGLFTSLIFKLV